ncbi:MAG: carbohydrate kinase [Methylococcales bacterium]
MAKPVIFGEVLFDHFPDDSLILGGAPFNVAWHLQAFGVEPLFISRVGDDELGRRIQSSMQDWGMDTSGLQIDSRYPTGTVEIEIDNGEPSYEIVINQAYDFIDANQLAEIIDGSLLYQGSLALRNPESRNALEELRTKLDLPVFVDVNLRAPWWDKDTVSLQLEAARWAKLNGEELYELSPVDGEMETQAKALQEACELSLLIVTLGEKGALARTAEGVFYHIEPEAHTPVVDAVGAGDAFTSVILLGLLSGWDLDKSLERAQLFASAVVGIRGATPTHKIFYKPFRNGN